MGKLIAKTAAITVAAVIAAALILFGAAGLIFPASLASLTDSLGMDGASAYYSVAAAERSGSAEDLAVAAERSFLSRHYEDAVSCGEKLLVHEDFSEYCSGRDSAQAEDFSVAGTYEQYVTGIVASSLYHCGDKAKALETAVSRLGGGFPENNAVVYLADAAIAAHDADFCSEIGSAVAELKPSSVEDLSYLKEFVSYLEKYGTR